MPKNSNPKTPAMTRIGQLGRRTAIRIAENATMLLWLTVPIAGIFALLMTVWALVNSDPERSKLLLSIAGSLAAIAAYAVGLIQYRRADYWKRCEFVAREMKEFFSDPKVNLTLIMIDWGARRIKLLEAAPADGSRPADSGVRKVDRATQCAALRPHTMPRPAIVIPELIDVMHSQEFPGSDETADEHVEQPEDLQTIGPWRFTQTEAAIRDCYDRFLDGLDRFGNYLNGDLVTVEDLKPYLGYWLQEIASADCGTADAIWTLYLWCYIDFYSFKGIQRLFEGFGYGISTERGAVDTLAQQSANPIIVRELLAEVRSNSRTRSQRSVINPSVGLRSEAA